MIIVGVPYTKSGLLYMDDIIGGTPSGASTLTKGGGSRQPTENELKIARFQGRHVAEIASKLAR
jgi:multimeric flavodoxin WrbA